MRTSRFECDLNIEDVRKAIAGRDDFREVKHEDYSVFVYFLGMAKDIFPNPKDATDPITAKYWNLRRECRGLVFDCEGRVIARRFHKFFNVNEVPETNASLIDLTRPFVITEKMDGSLISPFFTMGKLRFATKQGVTDTTALVEKYIEACQIPYTEFCTEWIEKGYTSMFEFCSPDTPIVLTYAETSLKLIGLRNNRDGEYLDHEALVNAVAKYQIPLVKCWTPSEMGIETTDRANFTLFEKKIKQTKDLEGFVIRFDDGDMIKIKTNWYFTLNKTLDKIKNCSERHLWKSILNEEYDDIKTFLPPRLRVATDAFGETISEHLSRLVLEIFNALAAADEQKLNGKDFATYGATFSPHFAKLLFLCRRPVTTPDKTTGLCPSQDEWPALFRAIIVAYCLQHVGQAKTFTNLILPLFNQLKFEKPDLYEPNIELDS